MHRVATLALRRVEELLAEREARDVARASKIHESTISNWRTGKSAFNPNLDTLERLAAALGTTVGELVAEKGQSFEERVRTLTVDQKLELAIRLMNEARGDPG
jgi:transcriptional regulator with XRE-family HTH domain